MTEKAHTGVPICDMMYFGGGGGGGGGGKGGICVSNLQMVRPSVCCTVTVSALQNVNQNTK